MYYRFGQISKINREVGTQMNRDVDSGDADDNR